MFGFLIGGEVNDDAVKLKTFTDMALNKYGNLPTDELGPAIKGDFDKDCYHIDMYTVNFRFKEIEEFLFSLESRAEEGKARTLTVFGNRKYAGFMLQVVDGENWHCSVSDGIGYRATGGAKKLAPIMKKKFGIRDFTKFMKGFR